MCGIAGIIYRNPSDRDHLGRDLLSLIQPLESRGPDSCGVALYAPDESPQQLTMVLRGQADWAEVLEWIRPFATIKETEVLADSWRLTVVLEPGFDWRQFKRSLHQQFPALHLSSLGHALEIYKAVGAVENLSRHYQVDARSGSHGIAHTRMATESVVDIEHCHPFTANIDLSIVHNGQISNYYKLRFQLEQAGIVFETQNDSEAIAHFIDYQRRLGHSLEIALEHFLSAVDGTYTFLVATADQMALVRDKFAAKPAVIYETDDRVAIASEYRAFLRLPDFDPNATLREPDAGEINIWTTVPAPRDVPAFA
jgi:methylamine---glutamate N-methyltransferase subunit A